MTSRDQPDLDRGRLDAPGFGPLLIAWNTKGIAELRFLSAAEPEELGRVPPELSILLIRYFDGDPVDPADLPVDLRGTPFQLRVWNALRRIRRGHVRSYGGIATDIGSPRAMRAVGGAVSRNPIAIVVPCHRIVESGNRLGGFSAGLDRKVRLLDLEGVHIEGGRVLPGQLALPHEH
jgi:O-6-methylguanine DNA methyltransferase